MFDNFLKTTHKKKRKRGGKKMIVPQVRRKRSVQKTHWFFRWPTLIVLLVLTFFLARSVIDLGFKYHRAASATVLAEQRYHELKERKTELQRRIKRLETETGFEEELRSKYNVSREGEQVIQLVGEEDSVKDEDRQNEGFVERASGFFNN